MTRADMPIYIRKNVEELKEEFADQPTISTFLTDLDRTFLQGPDTRWNEEARDSLPIPEGDPDYKWLCYNAGGPNTQEELDDLLRRHGCAQQILDILPRLTASVRPGPSPDRYVAPSILEAFQQTQRAVQHLSELVHNMLSTEHKWMSNLLLDLAKLPPGGTVWIKGSLQYQERCSTCEGKGFADPDSKKFRCNNCNGLGYHNRNRRAPVEHQVRRLLLNDANHTGHYMVQLTLQGNGSGWDNWRVEHQWYPSQEECQASIDKEK